MNNLVIRMECLASFTIALKLYQQEIFKMSPDIPGCLKVWWAGTKKLAFDELAVLEQFEA